MNMLRDWLAALVVATVAGVAVGDADADYREAMRLAYATNSSVLAEGKILVGGADNVAAAVTPSGNATISTGGVVTVTGAAGAFAAVGAVTVGTAGVVLTGDGDGAVTILGAGNGSDENLVLNLDDTSNAAVLTSGTGVAVLTLTGIGVASDGLVKGGTLGIGSGVLMRSGNALWWVEGAATNVLDADVTAP